MKRQLIILCVTLSSVLLAGCATTEPKEKTVYLGGEPIEREKPMGGRNFVLIDMQNRVPGGAAIVGAKLYALAPMPFHLCLLRETTDGLAVTWVSEEFEAKEVGVTSVSLKTPPPAEANDIIGLYCPDQVAVPYSRGAGDMRSARGPIKAGKSIGGAEIRSYNQRVYSFGVVGVIGEYEPEPKV